MNGVMIMIYDLCFKATTGNGAKSQMKHPPDMPTPRFELRCNDLLLTALPVKPERFILSKKSALDIKGPSKTCDCYVIS